MAAMTKSSRGFASVHNHNTDLDHDDPPPPKLVFGHLDLYGYRSLVSRLPIPTTDQVNAFVDHVCHARSWHRQVSMLSPTCKLQFFLDPHAGMQRIGCSDGSISVEPVLDCESGHSPMPTLEYQDRFGFLTFVRSEGELEFRQRSRGEWLLPSDADPVIFNSEGNTLMSLPPEVLEAGASNVSGLIHTLGASAAVWSDWLVGLRKLPSWPPESGGHLTMKRMQDRCEELATVRSLRSSVPVTAFNSRHEALLAQIDGHFYSLVEPERRRQIAGIRRAIEKMICAITEPTLH